VLVGDLGDRGHVDRVIEAPVAAHGQAVDLAAAGGHLDRRGAVVGGEGVLGGEPGGVGDVADDGGGDDRADAEDLGQRRAGRADGGGDLRPGVAEQLVDAAQVGQVRGGQVVPGGRDRPGRGAGAQDGGGPGRGDDLGDAAGG